MCSNVERGRKSAIDKICRLALGMRPILMVEIEKRKRDIEINS